MLTRMLNGIHRVARCPLCLTESVGSSPEGGASCDGCWYRWEMDDLLWWPADPEGRLCVADEEAA